MNDVDSRYIVRRSGRGSIRARLLNGASNLALPAFAGALALTLSWPASEAAAQCALTGTDQTCTNSIAITGGTTGISDTGTLTVTNTSTGTISGTSFGIDAAIANVTNSGMIQSTGIGIHGNGIGASTVTNNIGGVISGDGAAIFVNDRLNVTNAGKIDSTGIAIGSFTGVTVNNTGEITAGANAISSFGHVDVVNAGKIEATMGIGISARDSTTATINNLSGGIITAGIAGISGTNINVTGNAGLIEATGVNGRAITATQDVTVDNTGLIRTQNLGGVAISGATVTVNNAGGRITGTDVAIDGHAVTISNTGGIDVNVGGAVRSDGTVTVTNAAGAFISGKTFGIRGSSVNVTGNAGRIETIGSGGAPLLMLPVAQPP